MKFNYRRLRAERVARDLTMSEMGALLGIKESSYSKIECGLRGMDVDRFAKILTVLKVPLTDIPIFFAE